MPEMPTDPVQTPVVLAVVLADVVYRDPISNKYSMIGTFSGVASRTFPCTHPSLGIYVAMTDVYGEIPLVITIVNAENGKEIFRIEGGMKTASPLAVVEFGVTVHNVEFPEPANYRLQLSASRDATPLLERRITATRTVNQTTGLDGFGDFTSNSDDDHDDEDDDLTT
ncbi:MAG: DUF6941 family protein [Planctomycetota bacterium]